MFFILVSMSAGMSRPNRGTLHPFQSIRLGLVQMLAGRRRRGRMDSAVLLAFIVGGIFSLLLGN